MKTFIKSGQTLTFSHAGAQVSGVPASLGTNLAGVPAGSYDAAEAGEYDISGVHEFPKNTALALVFGTKYDWDIATGKIVAAAAGDFELGTAVEDKLAADTTGQILVNGLPRAFN